MILSDPTAERLNNSIPENVPQTEILRADPQIGRPATDSPSDFAG
jgi:hypothetical protein